MGNVFVTQIKLEPRKLWPTILPSAQRGIHTRAPGAKVIHNPRRTLKIEGKCSLTVHQLTLNPIQGRNILHLNTETRNQLTSINIQIAALPTMEFNQHHTRGTEAIMNPRIIATGILDLLTLLNGHTKSAPLQTGPMIILHEATTVILHLAGQLTTPAHHAVITAHPRADPVKVQALQEAVAHQLLAHQVPGQGTEDKFLGKLYYTHTTGTCIPIIVDLC